ncbi:MAG: tRNA epoxyqueuosine(34) reductase QueG [Bacteroidota bacterium]|nr:tRNA epoxyqueuosine(34) reductase QueG [Bacteroidota bacterium]
MAYIPFSLIEELSTQEDFCLAGAVGIEEIKEDFFNIWLQKDLYASMSYMTMYKEKRQNPALLVENAKSIICFLYSYNDERVDKESSIKIAHYAQRKDYHYVIKEKLNKIITKIQEKFSDFEARAFVDTAPILEKYWAKKCGLGWIGKSSLLINKDYGSKVFLGEIICNYQTDYNTSGAENKCGNCSLCLNACPNKAISKGNLFDANKCISYQTIENKEKIPDDFETMGFVYGCDICLEVCPWNKKAIKIPDQDIETKEFIKTILEKIKQGNLEKKDFKQLAKLSPINRIKYEKFLKNIGCNRLS